VAQHAALACFDADSLTVYEARRAAYRARRDHFLPALRDLYDEIWIYGLPQICEPLEGIALPASVRKKITYTGYLAREVSTGGAPPRLPEITKKPYILVTTGGGGDGDTGFRGGGLEQGLAHAAGFSCDE
jgi:predicted glycosyltransferase